MKSPACWKVDPSLREHAQHRRASWHDYGKSHPVFRGNIHATSEPWISREDIAKAPSDVWLPPLSASYNHPEANDGRYELSPSGRRPGFRHELATMLGLLELLACTDAQHPGILGASTELSQHFAEDRTREIAPEQQIAF